MQYIHHAVGDVPQFSLEEHDDLIPSARQVIIRVTAAGVNRPDVLQRKGLYPPPADASPILGLEVAGEIVSCGEGVTEWAVGDRVCALVNGGGYAEKVIAEADQCLPIPSGLTDVEAAALPETFFTVWYNLFQKAKLTAGQTLLVHGGASGIGITAITLAKAWGCRVIATTRSADKMDALAALGADVIQTPTALFAADVKSFTDGVGAHVILDMIGGDYVQQNISAAAKDGVIVNIAFLQGSKITVDLMPVMLKRLSLTGSTLRSQTPAVKAHIASELRDHVWPLFDEKKLPVIIDHVFAFSDAKEAHEHMESNQHIGKIVLIPDALYVDQR